MLRGKATCRSTWSNCCAPLTRNSPQCRNVADSTARHLRILHGPSARPAARARLRAGEIDAVLALNPTRLDDIVARLDAVREFASLPEAASLAAANKRISNILKKSGRRAGGGVQAALLHRSGGKGPVRAARTGRAARAIATGRARLHGRADRARRVARTGRHVLQRRDGERRRSGVARQPSGSCSAHCISR